MTPMTSPSTVRRSRSPRKPKLTSVRLPTMPPRTPMRETVLRLMSRSVVIGRKLAVTVPAARPCRNARRAKTAIGRLASPRVAVRGRPRAQRRGPARPAARPAGRGPGRRAEPSRPAATVALRLLAQRGDQPGAGASRQISLLLDRHEAPRPVEATVCTVSRLAGQPVANRDVGRRSRRPRERPQRGALVAGPAGLAIGNQARHVDLVAQRDAPQQRVAGVERPAR